MSGKGLSFFTLCFFSTFFNLSFVLYLSKYFHNNFGLIFPLFFLPLYWFFILLFHHFVLFVNTASAIVHHFVKLTNTCSIQLRFTDDNGITLFSTIFQQLSFSPLVSCLLSFTNSGMALVVPLYCSSLSLKTPFLHRLSRFI